MAVAGQETSLQGIQNSHSLSKPNTDTENNPTASPPSYNQAISNWQHLVEKKLKTDLMEYGITLIRLNIEEIKILDTEVEKKLSEQSYRVAEANANLAAVGMERQVAEQRALTESRVAQVKAEQVAQTQLINARTQNEVAEIKRKTRVTAARAEVESLVLEANVFTKNPALLQLRLAEIQAKALKPTDKIISLGHGDNNPLLGFFAGSSLLHNPQTILSVPTQQCSSLPSHTA